MTEQQRLEAYFREHRDCCVRPGAPAYLAAATIEFLTGAGWTPPPEHEAPDTVVVGAEVLRQGFRDVCEAVDAMARPVTCDSCSKVYDVKPFLDGTRPFVDTAGGWEAPCCGVTHYPGAHLPRRFVNTGYTPR